MRSFKLNRKSGPTQVSPTNLPEMTFSQPKVKTESKQELYEKRVRNQNHREKFFVEPSFFHTNNPKEELKNTIRKFNEIVERETGGLEYSVTLRYGIPKIAADFSFQYLHFQPFAKDHALLPEIMDEFSEIGAVNLYKSLTWKESTGRFSLSKAFFEATSDLSPTGCLLLILYKAFSNKPNREVLRGEYVAVTGLSDSRAANLLGCSRKTIATHRVELEQRGYIETALVSKRYRKTHILKGV
jgi:hypothetical protein